MSFVLELISTQGFKGKWRLNWDIRNAIISYVYFYCIYDTEFHAVDEGISTYRHVCKDGFKRHSLVRGHLQGKEQFRCNT